MAIQVHSDQDRPASKRSVPRQLYVFQVESYVFEMFKVQPLLKTGEKKAFLNTVEKYLISFLCTCCVNTR